ncbi:MAG: EF-hand domain-containing protein [Rhodobacteraceae bacterium]|nr:EF-hand domain-containing protein [Paracoccaceae bacterium]
MKRSTRLASMTALAMGAATVIGGALPVLAQDAPSPRVGALFDRLDTDKNGTVSVEEFTARATARFAALDADGDGAISAEEATRMGPPAGAMRNGPQGRFAGRGHGARGDCDMYGHMGMRGGRAQGMGPGMWGGGYGMFGGMLGAGPMGSGGFGDPRLSDEDRAARAAQLVEMLDADGDGKLSPEEMATRPGPQMMFNRVDADGDGSISQDEFDAAVQKFGAGMRGN